VPPDRAVVEARDFLAARRRTVDASTVAWVDQKAARLTERASLSALVAAWNQDGAIRDIDREELLLGRLVVATAIVAKVMPARIETS
jgi:hypothetical protein